MGGGEEFVEVLEGPGLIGGFAGEEFACLLPEDFRPADSSSSTGLGSGPNNVFFCGKRNRLTRVYSEQAHHDHKLGSPQGSELDLSLLVCLWPGNLNFEFPSAVDCSADCEIEIFNPHHADDPDSLPHEEHLN
jgi:hypothetical protein